MKYLIILFMMVCSVGWAEEIRWDDLVSAVIQVESGGNSNAVSSQGAIGLMQITPIVLKEYMRYYKKDEFIQAFREDSLLRPQVNKDIGTWYLHRLHNHYLKGIAMWDDRISKTIQVEREPIGWDDRPLCIFIPTKYIKNANDYKIALILAAYNGGITRLEKVNYDINKMPKKTRDYVKRVMSLYREWEDRWYPRPH